MPLRRSKGADRLVFGLQTATFAGTDRRSSNKKEEDGKGAASDKFKLAKNIEVLAQSTQESNVALISRKKEYEKKWEGVEKKYDAEKAKLMSASSA